MAIREIGDILFQNLQVAYRAHALEYKGVNLGISTFMQLKVKARARAKARMLAKGHVVATLLLEECEDDTHTLEMGTWESTGTPKISEFDCKGQNTSH
jgi:hypothetical protein